MKKLESSLKNMLLVLTGVTVVSVALLAYMNVLTAEPIAQAQKKALDEALKEVLPDFDEITTDTLFKEDKNGKQVVDFIVYPAKKAGEWVGTAVQSTSHKAFSGDLTLLVGFDTKGTVLNYSILQSAETPGLGSKAAEWFGGYKKSEGQQPVVHSDQAKASVIGMNPGEAELKVNKDCPADYAGRVDAITASTITSRAFLEAINLAYATYMGQDTDAMTGATGKKTNDEQPAEADGNGAEAKQ